MDPTKMTMVQWMLIGAGVGAVVGLVPLIAGVIKGKLKLGLLGLLASAVGGSVMSLILSVPIALIFTWLAVRKPAASPQIAVDQDQLSSR